MDFAMAFSIPFCLKTDLCDPCHTAYAFIAAFANPFLAAFVTAFVTDRYCDRFFNQACGN